MFKMYDSIEEYQTITLVYLMSGARCLLFLKKEFACYL